LRGLRQRRPVALQADRDRFGVDAPHSNAAEPAFVVAAVAGEAGEQLAQPYRQGAGVAVILQALAQQAQVQERALATRQIGRVLAQQVDQRDFERDALFKALRRRVLDADLQVGGQRRVVAGDAQVLEIVQRAAQLFRDPVR
jgi:hypothetical protein